MSTSTTTTDPLPAVLACSPRSVREAFAIVRALGGSESPLWPRHIVAELERRSGEAESIDTVNHALATLRRLGLAASGPRGWRICDPPAIPDLSADLAGRNRERARLVARWAHLAELVEQLRAEVRDGATRGALTTSEAATAERSLDAAAAAIANDPPAALVVKRGGRARSAI